MCRDKGLEDIHLVCTGLQRDFRQRGYFRRMVKLINDLKLEEHVTLTGLLERQEQVQLLRLSAMVVQPSLFEGWSAIIEDARTLGKNMLVSDIGVHREQTPPRCEYFDPYCYEALSTKLLEIWPTLTTGPDLRHETRAYDEHLVNGLRFARSFMNIVRQASELGPNPARN